MPHRYNPDGVLAFFITFRTYGTWLHGDGRGSVHRTGDNVYGSRRARQNEGLRRREVLEAKSKPVRFGEDAREIVGKAIMEVCEVREWMLQVLSVQVDHVHAVVTGNGKPEVMMADFKRYATRALRNAGLCEGEKVWSRHGSTKWVWSEDELERVCGYVKEMQALPPVEQDGGGAEG